MVNDLIDAISIKLNAEFGSGYRIYADETVEQGLQAPCFFIAVLNPSQTPRLGRRYHRQHPFDVHYFPAAQGNNTEMQAVAGNLYEVLEYVTLLNGDMVRGTELHHETVDGVLHFFVQYNMHVVQTADQEPMEEFTINTMPEG